MPTKCCPRCKATKDVQCFTAKMKWCRMCQRAYRCAQERMRFDGSVRTTFVPRNRRGVLATGGEPK